MADHARLSPSSASIWMNCPGQPALADGLERTENVHMRRGTAAHALLEYCWKKPANPNAVTAASFEAQYQLAFDQDDLQAVQDALDYIRGEFEEGDEAETEARLRYSDDLWGTCDWSRYRPSTGELVVVDYKHGAGVAVDVTGPQTGIYGLMKAKSLGNRGITSVRFVIVQPRCFHKDGPIREYVIDGVDLLDFEDKVVAAVEATRSPTAPLVTGSWCRWCPAAAICPQARADAEADAQATFDALTAYDPADLGKTLAKLDRIEGWAKAVREFAYAEAERGIKIPGWKLVPKRASEKWKDTAAAIATLEVLGYDKADLLTEPELKSPAQVRAVLAATLPGKTKKDREAAARAEMADLIDKVSSGHNLAPETDDRSPVRSDATEDFAPVS